MTTQQAPHDTRQHLLRVGYQLISAKGFSSVGLAELLRQAGVPKGSFYHYFDSKGAFGTALIEDYFSEYLAWLAKILTAPDCSGKEKLFTYWQQWQVSQTASCPDRRCLVVKLSAEVSGLSEPMRLALLQGCRQVIGRIAKCIQEGQLDGSISVVIPAKETARTLYYLWLGACLANILTQDDEPLKIAMRHTRQVLV